MVRCGGRGENRMARRKECAKEPIEEVYVSILTVGSPESSFPRGAGSVPGGAETRFPNRNENNGFRQGISFPPLVRLGGNELVRQKQWGPWRWMPRTGRSTTPTQWAPTRQAPAQTPILPRRALWITWSGAALGSSLKVLESCPQEEVAGNATRPAEGRRLAPRLPGQQGRAARYPDASAARRPSRALRSTCPVEKPYPCALRTI
jgi:hypothetical protein